MNVLELKGSIIERVAQLQNPSLLAHLDSIIKDFIESGGEDWYKKTDDNNFTAEQIANLIIAEKECDDPSNLVSHDEAVKEIEGWLKR